MESCFTQGCPARRGSCPSSLPVVPPRTCAPPGPRSIGSPPPRVPPTKSPVSRVKDDVRGSLGAARSARGDSSPVLPLSDVPRAIPASPMSSSSLYTLSGQSGTSWWWVEWSASGRAAETGWTVCSGWAGVPALACLSALIAAVLASREVYGELSSYQICRLSLVPSSASCMPSM